jgi:macrodomain Ter protein organizer (MatP/YcbG family)
LAAPGAATRLAAGRLATDPRIQPGREFQANPNKNKKKSLDFLGFVWWNRDFSMGYAQKKKKNRLASQVVCKLSHGSYAACSIRLDPDI